MAQPMNINLAMWTARRYVCARCWHHLLLTVHDGQDWIECSNAARCDGQGYVTKWYAERRLEESYWDLRDARQNLQSILPVQTAPQSKRSEMEILSELGY